jgi:hypothetical protein
MVELSDIKRYIQEKWSTAETFRKIFDKRWYKNLLYTYGNQWLLWDDVEEKYTEAKFPKYKKRNLATANRIFATIRTVINKLVGIPINITVIPKKEDKTLAEVCNKILSYVLGKYGNIEYELAFDLLVFGKTFIKCVFDPDEGELIEGTDLRIGDIVLSHLTPFEVYLDPLATSIDTAQWCFICKIRSAEYIRDKYGVEVKSTVSVLPTIFQLLEIYYGKKPHLPKDMVLIKEFWMKPTKDYPNGLFVILANEDVIKVEENPYRDISGRIYLPLVEMNFFVTNNQLYGTSLVEQLIPLQREYNKLRTDIMIQEEMMTKPKWLIATQSGVSDTSITGEPGEKIYYDGRYPAPTAVQGIPPSPELWQHLSFIKTEFDDIAGVHDVSRGKVPSGVRSYVAISYLQEQDTSLLAITRNNMVQGYKKLGYMILSQAKQFFIEDRMLTIIGREGQYELYKFDKSSLSDLSEANILILEGSSLPQSMVARQQFILSLWQSGLISNPQKVLELLGLPSLEVFEDTKLDERNASNENLSMMNNVYVEVQRSDNHQVHLNIHYNFLKENPNLSPEIRELFDKHCDTHQKLINLQMMMLQQFMPQVLPKRSKKQQKI